jgi:hypothetical protein
LPVITFKPIAGHGKDNAEGMAEIGVSRYARTEDELRDALAAVTQPGAARAEQVSRAAALFAGDAKVDVLELAEHRDREKVVEPIRDPKAQRRFTGVLGVIVLLYLGLTLGAQAVSALGVGVARPPKGAQSEVFVGVRLTDQQLDSTAIQRQLHGMGVTAIIDGGVARDGHAALIALSARHVDIGNGGWGHGRPFRFLRAKNDVAKTADLIRTATGGYRVREFVPERRLDAFDQIWCHRRGQRLVEPDSVFKPEQVPDSVKARKVYVLDGRQRDTEALRVALEDFGDVVYHDGLSVSSLAQLR